MYNKKPLGEKNKILHECIKGPQIQLTPNEISLNLSFEFK